MAAKIDKENTPCSHPDCGEMMGRSGRSGLCQSHYHESRGYSKAKTSKGYEIECKTCGKNFFAKGPTYRFCSDTCKEAGKRKRIKANYEKHKETIIASQKKYVEKNKEKTLAYQKQWREENKGYITQYKKEYYAIPENRERSNRKSRENYLKNKEKYKEATRNWERNNPHKVRATKKKYRAKREGWIQDGFQINKSFFNRVLNRYNHSCAYCRKHLTSETMHWDHVEPLSRGGVHGESNIVPSCPACNLEKGNKFVSEWKKWKQDAEALV